jgi:uncharacterized protein YfaS (alpha-2-macroglobulin family)
MNAGLASHSGNKLATAQTCEAASEAMPPSFYFASKGLVLPAGQNGGLPVVSINTPEVDVQFLRVKPASLPAFLEQVGGRRERNNGGSSTEDGDYTYDGYGDNQRRLKGTVGGWALDELRAMTDSVYLTRFKTDERANRRNVSFLPVEKIKDLQEPGIYIAVMSQPGRFGWDYQVTHYYVTDIGLHLRRHAAQLDVFTTSLKTGKAQSGIELSLVDEAGKALAQAQTDGDGHAVFTGANGKIGDKARAVMARKGNEMSILSLRDAALDLSEFDATGHPSRSNKLFVYAGRDLYRPGETFNVSVLSRGADGRVPAKLLPLTLTVKKPDGNKLVEQLVQPNKLGQGYFQQTITLPADAPTGGWTLQARVDPAAKTPDAQWAFKVEEFLPERMKLTLTAPDAALTGEVHLPVQVQGDYLYGAPAAGNRLQATISTERQPAGAEAARLPVRRLRRRQGAQPCRPAGAGAGRRRQGRGSASRQPVRAQLADEGAWRVQPAGKRRPPGGAQHRAHLVAGARAGGRAPAVRPQRRARRRPGRLRGGARGRDRRLQARQGPEAHARLRGAPVVLAL